MKIDIDPFDNNTIIRYLENYKSILQNKSYIQNEEDKLVELRIKDIKYLVDRLSSNNYSDDNLRRLYKR